MRQLDKKFFNKKTIEIAQNILGKIISYDKMAGKIVEVEAYLSNDPASHSFFGKTDRNSPMFSEAGKSYVYFTYGMYYCFNITTNKKGIGEAVLIRAVEPLKGINKMKENRVIKDEKNLTNGPAKFTQAFGFTKNHNNINLLSQKSPIKIFQKENEDNFRIIKTTRIGIKNGANLLYRFYIKDNKFISRK